MPSCAMTVPTAEPSEAEVQAVDEPQLEHDVRQLRGHDDEQRRAQVADPAQVALAGQRDQRRRQAERADAQVALGHRRRLPRPAEYHHERGGEHGAGQRERAADRGREPERLGGELVRPDVVAGAVQPRDLRRRPEGEKDADADERREHRRGDRQRRELGVPRCPTIAVSTSRYRGSAASAPSAGTARRRISRS